MFIVREGFIVVLIIPFTYPFLLNAPVNSVLYKHIIFQFCILFPHLDDNLLSTIVEVKLFLIFIIKTWLTFIKMLILRSDIFHQLVLIRKETSSTQSLKSLHLLLWGKTAPSSPHTHALTNYSFLCYSLQHHVAVWS